MGDKSKRKLKFELKNWKCRLNAKHARNPDIKDVSYMADLPVGHGRLLV